MQIKNALLFVLLSLVTSSSAYTYLPNVVCYDKKDYQAGRQNWDVDIDDNGIVYFANTDGLLCNVYGEWILKKVSDSQAVRSVLVSNDTIWCGGNEFGYFLKGDGHHLEYHLLEKVKGGQIWNIERFEEVIYFQTEHLLITYDLKTDSISQQYYQDGIWGFTEWNGRLWMVQRHGSIGYLDGLEYKEVIHSAIFEEKEVRRIFVHQGQLHFVMFDGRVFLFDGETISQKRLPQELSGETLFSGTPYDDNSLCLGSISNGFFRVDNNGNYLNHVNASHGLIDNTVLSMKIDRLGNAWLGLDYGIAKVELQNPINTAFKDGATYYITDHHQASYLATNKGLFYSSDH